MNFSAKNPYGLTRREAEVLRHVAAGLTTRQIAERMALATCTVNDHCTAVRRKTNTSTRAEAVDILAEALL